MMTDHGFQEVCKSAKRMCEAFGEDCRACPLDSNCCCTLAWYADDYIKVESTIMEWAKNNPEPEYPTWKEWLEEQRVVVHFDSVSTKGKKVKWELTNKSNCPIPDEIAQLLGLKPVMVEKSKEEQ